MSGGLVTGLLIGVVVGVACGVVAGRRIERSAYAFGYSRRYAREGWSYAGRAVGAVAFCALVVVGAGAIWWAGQ